MTQLNTPLSLVALACAVTALVLGLLREPVAAAGPPLTQASGVGLASVEERLAELAAEVRHLRSPLVIPATERLVAVPDDGGVSDIDARISRLESEVGALRAAREGRNVIAQLRKDREEEKRRTTEEAGRLALSPVAADAEKLAALRELRFGRLEDGADARTPEVVAEMIALAQRSTEAGTRADFWRQLDGVTDPALRQPLLDALAHDPDAKVREEAAETLHSYLPDAQVETALRFAAENDPNEDVRKQSLASLR